MNCIGGSRPTYGDCVEAGQLQKTHALSEQLQKYQSGNIIHLIFNELFSNITDRLDFFEFKHHCCSTTGLLQQVSSILYGGIKYSNRRM